MTRPNISGASHVFITERRTSEIEKIIRHVGIDFELKETEGPEHGIQLAQDAANPGNIPLIAIGGDGTFLEVVNGLMRANHPDALPAGLIGFMSMGTANDLTDVLKIPRDLQHAARIITEGHTRLIDVGHVNGRFFDNNSAIDLEPMVTLGNIRMAWLLQ